MIVRAVPWDDEGATALREAQRAGIEERYGTPDSEPGIHPSAADIAVFLVAYSDEDEPVGCGGLRQLNGTEGEIKRMFVRPANRGTGVSTAILDALESEARQRGWSRLLLETGSAQPDAIRFYEREGYTPIPLFGGYIGSTISLCYAKDRFGVDPADGTICEGCE
jgi:GNAT superfamily N-acetyltransferase